MKNTGERQKTIASEIKLQGVGLHSGKQVTMTLSPVSTPTGIVFHRQDLTNGSSTVLSHFSNVVNLDHSTNLGDRSHGPIAQTVEHLLATLHAFGIDNLMVHLDAPEVPITDGSAKVLTQAIAKVGCRELPYFKERILIRQTVEHREGDRFIRITPFPKLKITYHIDFPSRFIGKQTFVYTLTESSFIEKIAPARTFCMLHEVNYLKSHGLALGGSLDNAIVVADDGILNDSLRFSDEFVRHKILDLVGDLFLLGKPVIGHVEVNMGGHQLHTRLIREILAHPEAYTLEKARPVRSEYAGPAQANLTGRSFNRLGLITLSTAI